jgi:Domain of unknown function (DUF4432)
VGVPLSSLYGVPLTREELRRRTGRVEQLLGAELVERADGSERGVRCVRLRSGAIELEVVVDRALDLAQATIGGVPVAWISPTGLASPSLAVPSGWEPFRTFFGGLLTTCGLEHTLGPMEDDATHFHYPGRPTHAFPLHGRLSATPGRLLGYGVDWERQCVYCRGDVRQAHVFGESLTLEREIRIGLGGATIELDDVVRNDGFAPTPHMLLYHVNLGWPLLGERAEVLAGVGEPRVATPAAQGADWRVVEPPRFPFTEQVWEHTPSPDPGGLGRAAILNTDIGDGRPLGVELAWSHATLPRLFQWRVMSEQNYVIGLEPGNAPIEGRARAREEGTLVVLAPGEERRTSLRLTLHNEAGGLVSARERVAACKA